MIATNATYIDGQWYKPGDEIWDLGSFEAVEVQGRQRHYEGFSSDIGKLPHYVGAGSSALCLDTGQVYKYHGKSKTWILLG